MDRNQRERWERNLVETAAHYAYPPTPDISMAVLQRLTSTRRQVWGVRPVRVFAGALAAILLLLAVAMAVPQVRAAVLDFLQIGALRIFVDEKPAPTDAPDSRLLDLYGATTMDEAAARVDFPIQLPTGPRALGPPDHVYLQNTEEPDADGDVLILVWEDPDKEGQVLMSLYEINMPYYGIKGATVESLRETHIKGRPALWIDGPHRIQLQSGAYSDWLFVEGSVLLWAEETVTYRLESGLSFEEAVRIAESLEPVNGE